MSEVLGSSGQPLDAATRAYFEPRFQRDFSAVRVHREDDAASSARAEGVAAYTVGHHIIFGRRRFQPQSSEGRRLLAHELAHVVQQTGSGSPPGPQHETEAYAAADAVFRGSNPQVVLTSRAGVAAQPEPALGKLAPEEEAKLREFEKLLAQALKSTSLKPPRSQEVDLIIAGMQWYRKTAPPMDFAHFVMTHGDDLAWWLRDHGFRGTRFKRSDSGSYSVDLYQTQQDFDRAIDHRARVRARQPVEQVWAGPTLDQLEAKEERVHLEQLEDGRVFEGPRRALRKEKSYAVGNVVQQKIAGVKQAGPLSLAGRVIGTAAGGERWGDYLSKIGSFGDALMAFRAANTARRQASSANYDESRPTPRGAPDPQHEVPRSAPRPAHEPLPMPGSAIKPLTEGGPSITTKGASTPPGTTLTVKPPAGLSPATQRPVTNETKPASTPPAERAGRLARLNDEISVLEQKLVEARAAADRAWREAQRAKEKLKRSKPLTDHEQSLVGRHNDLMKERTRVEIQLSEKRTERAELRPRFSSPARREEWRAREIQAGALLSTIAGKDNVFTKPIIARLGRAQLPVELKEGRLTVRERSRLGLSSNEVTPEYVVRLPDGRRVMFDAKGLGKHSWAGQKWTYSGLEKDGKGVVVLGRRGLPAGEMVEGKVVLLGPKELDRLAADPTMETLMGLLDR